jgi:hypothetical protein
MMITPISLKFIKSLSRALGTPWFSPSVWTALFQKCSFLPNFSP